MGDREPGRPAGDTRAGAAESEGAARGGGPGAEEHEVKPLTALIIGAVVGGPLALLAILLGLAISALEAYAAWCAYRWHLAPAFGWPPVSYAVVWAADIVVTMLTTHLKYAGEIKAPWGVVILSRPTAAAIAIVVLWWLR